MTEFVADNLYLILGMLAAGFAAGFAGGLFGIGGGIITVPALYAVFQAVGVNEDASLKTAIGTSLGVIIVTSLRARLAHSTDGLLLSRLFSAYVLIAAIGLAWDVFGK